MLGDTGNPIAQKFTDLVSVEFRDVSLTQSANVPILLTSADYGCNKCVI